MRLDFEKKEKRNSKRRSIFRGAIIILSVLVLHSAFFLWKNRSNAGSDKFDEKTSSEGKVAKCSKTVQVKKFYTKKHFKGLGAFAHFSENS